MKRGESVVRGKRVLGGSGGLRSWAAIGEYLCAEFPGCEKDPPGGREVVRVGGKVLAHLAVNERSRAAGTPANEEFVVVRIGFERRAELLESNPEAYFVTPHYQNWPAVIVRLTTVDQRELKELLSEAWRFVAPRRMVRARDAEGRVDRLAR